MRSGPFGFGRNPCILTLVKAGHRNAPARHEGGTMGRTAFGGAFAVLVSLKETLDPGGILNPGKLGLPSPFGEVSWP